MNSGAPASTAPPESASAGKIVPQSACRVLYPCASKYFGVYAPADAFFSAMIMRCACSAACSGITRSTDVAAAPMVSDFRIERRETPVFDDVPSLRDSVIFPRLPRAYAPGYLNSALRAEASCHVKLLEKTQ